MLIVGLLLSIAGLGVFCWVVFNLAVFALPFFAGLSAGLAALQSGTGAIGAVLVGVVAGVVTLVVGQVAFSTSHSPAVRVPVALLFATPAAVAGYHLSLHLAELTSSSDAWRQAFAIIGAAVVGITALGRLTIEMPPRRAAHALPAE